MAWQVNPTTGQLEQTETPYNQFRGTNAPVVNDKAAGNLSAGLMSSYQPGRTASSVIPQETLSQLGKVSSAAAAYKPEKIEVSKVQTMPTEYYQKQVEDLSAPITQQYDLARSKARGDQAARGTIYDSEGYKDIGQLDKSYLEQLGSITRGTQLQRMQDEQASARDYATRYDAEAADRRKMGLEGLSTSGNLLTGAAKTYGDIGTQFAGLDANALNSLLGYGADRYGTEATLFGNVYGADMESNRALLEDQRKRNETRRQNILDTLNLQGYQDFPQEQLLEGFSTNELGYNVGDLKTQQVATGNAPTPEQYTEASGLSPAQRRVYDSMLSSGRSPTEALRIASIQKPGW